jgi:hypothetical protein
MGPIVDPFLTLCYQLSVGRILCNLTDIGHSNWRKSAELQIKDSTLHFMCSVWKSFAYFLVIVMKGGKRDFEIYKRK